MLLELAGAALRMKAKDHTRLMDKTIHRLKVYAESLETDVAIRTEELLTERKKCDDLLHELLPK